MKPIYDDLYINRNLTYILEQIIYAQNEHAGQVANEILNARYNGLASLSGKKLVNFLTLQQTGNKFGIGYLDNKRITATLKLDRPEDTGQLIHLLDSPLKYTGKPGRVALGLLGDVFTPKYYEEFALEFRRQTEIVSDISLEVWDGEGVRKAYHEENYGEGGGSLGSSCMRHARCQEYFDLYVNNADKVKILVALNTQNKVVGRALLWCKDGKLTYIDRIYATNSLIENVMINFGRGHKLKNIWREDLNIRVDVDVSNISLFPYLDSFRFMGLDTDKGIWYLSTVKPYSECPIMESIYGCYTQFSTCTTCGYEGHHSVNMIGNGNESLHYCDNCTAFCEVDSRYYPKDALVRTQHNKMIHNRYAYYCIQNDTWYELSDTSFVYSSYYGCYVIENLVRRVPKGDSDCLAYNADYYAEVQKIGGNVEKQQPSFRIILNYLYKSGFSSNCNCFVCDGLIEGAAYNFGLDPELLKSGLFACRHKSDEEIIKYMDIALNYAPESCDSTKHVPYNFERCGEPEGRLYRENSEVTVRRWFEDTNCMFSYSIE